MPPLSAAGVIRLTVTESVTQPRVGVPPLLLQGRETSGRALRPPSLRGAQEGAAGPGQEEEHMRVGQREHGVVTPSARPGIAACRAVTAGMTRTRTRQAPQQTLQVAMSVCSGGSRSSGGGGGGACPCGRTPPTCALGALFLGVTLPQAGTVPTLQRRKIRLSPKDARAGSRGPRSRRCGWRQPPELTAPAATWVPGGGLLSTLARPSSP